MVNRRDVRGIEESSSASTVAEVLLKISVIVS